VAARKLDLLDSVVLHTNRFTSFIFAALLLALLIALHAADVVNLRCEYLTVPFPFSWASVNCG
jgi:hypothetical protein